MSGAEAVDIIAEGMRTVTTQRMSSPREDGRLWGAFPNSMTLHDLAEHVVSVLAASGHTIVPTSESGALQRVRGVHSMERFGYPESFTFCLHCQTAWPCVTIRAAISTAAEEGK